MGGGGGRRRGRVGLRDIVPKVRKIRFDKVNFN